MQKTKEEFQKVADRLANSKKGVPLSRIEIISVEDDKTVVNLRGRIFHMRSEWHPGLPMTCCYWIRADVQGF